MSETDQIVATDVFKRHVTFHPWVYSYLVGQLFTLLPEQGLPLEERGRPNLRGYSMRHLLGWGWVKAHKSIRQICEFRAIRVEKPEPNYFRYLGKLGRRNGSDVSNCLPMLWVKQFHILERIYTLEVFRKNSDYEHKPIDQPGKGPITTSQMSRNCPHK